jgi:hypothetical protein
MAILKLKFKGEFKEVISRVFQSLLVVYLILLLVEQVFPGRISFYFNLNYLLIAVIVFGVLDVFSNKNFEDKSKKEASKGISWKDYVFISILAVLGFAIIKYKTSELGWLSWLISIIAGVLIYLLSLLVLEEDEEKSAKEIKEARKLTLKQKILVGAGIIGILFLLGIIISIFSSLSLLESLRIVFGSVYVLFLPGFIISYIFFPETRAFEDSDSEEVEDKKSRGIDWIERIALSFALSIAIVPLAVFYLNLIGVKINLINSSLTIFGIIVISLIIIYFKNRRTKL